jgi:hypothetical protein
MHKPSNLSLRTDVIGSPKRRLRSLIVASLALYLGSRVVGYLAVLASTWLEPQLRVKQAYTAWDGYWYLRIAEHGYPSSVAAEAGGGNPWAFFPGFPFIIRVTTYVTHLPYADAAILAAWILGALAAVTIGLLVRDVLGHETALKAVALVMFYPASFVLNMVYAEGLFLTCAAACLLCIRRERWVLAALFANFACITKETGLVLVLAIASEALSPARTSRSRGGIVVAAAASSMAFVGWCLYGLARTNHLFAFLDAEKAWRGSFVWFETPFRASWHLLTSRAAWHMPTYVTAGIGLALVVVGYGFLIRLHLRGPGVSLAWWTYSIGTTLVAFSPFWPTSILRYTLIIIPLFAAFAHLARPRILDFTVGAFGLAQGVVAVVVFVSIVNGHPASAP